MGNTAISWTNKTWNPVVGCTRVSAGCDHCYAFQLHDQRHVSWKRGRWPDAPKQYHQPFSHIQLLPERLEDPLHWHRPCRIFVNSMSDLFHPDIPDDYIHRVFEVMLRAEQHTFQVLTKRPERMQQVVRDVLQTAGWFAEPAWAPSNIWLGVSVENQQAADERIPLLIQTPAVVRFLSCEPLLSAVDITEHLGLERIEPDDPSEHITYDRFEQSPIDWVIVGGESGKYARLMRLEWARYLKEQCEAADVAFYFKQVGGRTAKSGGDLLDGVQYHNWPRI